MDRVILPGEAPGSATYYLMGDAEEFGRRLYSMERHGDAAIKDVLMDVGTERTEPHLEIHCREDFSEIVRDSRGKTVYSCRFNLIYKGLDISLLIDFEARRLTISVDPSISLEQKKILAEFADTLYNSDYYEIQEMEEIEDKIEVPENIRSWMRTIFIILCLCLLFNLLGLIDVLDYDSALLSFTRDCATICMAIQLVYLLFLSIKRFQLKRQRKKARKDKA